MPHIKLFTVIQAQCAERQVKPETLSQLEPKNQPQVAQNKTLSMFQIVGFNFSAKIAI